MSALKVVFAGTPEFAVPALEAVVAAGHRVVAVYTQPDRPAGRGQRVQIGAVKACAQHNGLPIKQPVNLRDPGAASDLSALNADVMIVVAYGLLLPQAILDIPRLGCLNIHGSLLPRWRGAAPIQRAIMARDEVTGISIMRMEAGLDTGPVLSTAQVSIGPHTTAAQLHDQLATLGAQTLVETLRRYAAGELPPKTQPNEGVTYATKLRKEEALIDWRHSAVELDAFIRAFNPWPVAETLWKSQQLRVWEAQLTSTSVSAVPGTVLSAMPSGIVVATGDGALNLLRLQLAGRKVVSAGDFINAHSIEGAVLGATI
ncbi:MAG: methionyl-tRNA formyltransferase [Candidatus Obscuribacterales bacterium]|nr:methionyl-tRNA formyltransferase [Steroidobacteraceae bacterium]